MLPLVSRGCGAPDHDGSVGAALAHDGHPCGGRHLHGLGDIRDHRQQEVPCDRMECQHPSQHPHERLDIRAHLRCPLFQPLLQEPRLEPPVPDQGIEQRQQQAGLQLRGKG